MKRLRLLSGCPAPFLQTEGNGSGDVPHSLGLLSHEEGRGTKTRQETEAEAMLAEVLNNEPDWRDRCTWSPSNSLTRGLNTAPPNQKATFTCGSTYARGRSHRSSPALVRSSFLSSYG
jgi:hypothetical protein